MDGDHEMMRRLFWVRIYAHQLNFQVSTAYPCTYVRRRSLQWTDSAFIRMMEDNDDDDGTDTLSPQWWQSRNARASPQCNTPAKIRNQFRTCKHYVDIFHGAPETQPLLIFGLYVRTYMHVRIYACTSRPAHFAYVCRFVVIRSPGH